MNFNVRPPVPAIPGPAVPGATRCQHCYADIVQPVVNGAFFALGASSADVAVGKTIFCSGTLNVRHKPLPKVN